MGYFDAPDKTQSVSLPHRKSTNDIVRRISVISDICKQWIQDGSSNEAKAYAIVLVRLSRKLPIAK